MNKFMKKLLLSLLLLSGFAAAQPTVTTPQSVTLSNFFNQVFSAQTSSNFQNLGQTVHVLTYTLNNGSTPAFVQVHLEASFDGATYFPISDDALDLNGGSVVAIGAYPFIRANLVQCDGCTPGGAGINYNMSYTGFSAAPNIPSGNYNPSQAFRKVVFSDANAASTQTSSSIIAPYGSTYGYLVVVPPAGGFTGSASIAVAASTGSASFAPPTFNLATGGTSPQLIPIYGLPATNVAVTYIHGTTPSNTFSVFYVFLPVGALPPGAQPPLTQNSETISAANTAIQLNFTGLIGTFTVFSISARCSAGTSGLNIKDNGVIVWSSGAAEVGTSTFHFAWSPGLGVGQPNDGIQINMAACGVSNTGTLDLQASVL